MVPDVSQAIRYGRDATRLKPDLALAWSNISGRERLLGYDEMALKDREVAVRLLNGRAGADVSAQLLILFRLTCKADLDIWHGDYRGAANLEYQALDHVDRTYRRSQILISFGHRSRTRPRFRRSPRSRPDRGEFRRVNGWHHWGQGGYRVATRQ